MQSRELVVCRVCCAHSAPGAPVKPPVGHSPHQAHAACCRDSRSWYPRNTERRLQLPRHATTKQNGAAGERGWGPPSPCVSADRGKGFRRMQTEAKHREEAFEIISTPKGLRNQPTLGVLQLSLECGSGRCGETRFASSPLSARTVVGSRASSAASSSITQV